ncbi:glycosyltransferase [Thalassotalea sp. M1531]|uniref:Glycosyltransferase n=1 Tax=Thalassotalea algicola TaxID=2716224 RepID=A0A7Y0LEX0_9GAMM|nr:glycosyltransferase [Thalassotalea algicola]NMP32962.1 glycosyltransferase [Thalassotalea algicola]
MQNNALVTVYIATHNRSDMLIRAIKSVLRQSYSPIEIIVADDCSIDDTYQKLQPFIESNQVRYIKNEKAQGACVARNKAIDIAKGEFITGMDDDDAMEPNRIEHLLEEYLSDDYSCIASSIKERTPQGDIVRKMDIGDVHLDDLLHYNILGNQVLTRTEYLRSIGGFDPEMPAFQDYDTWVRLVSKFGVAKKSTHASYVWFTDHAHGRISESSDKRKKAFNNFYQKHSPLMNHAHKNSFEILRRKLVNEPYGFFDFIKLTNKGNWKASLSLFVNQNIRALKYLLDLTRTKFNSK